MRLLFSCFFCRRDVSRTGNLSSAWGQTTKTYFEDMEGSLSQKLLEMQATWFIRRRLGLAHRSGGSKNRCQKASQIPVKCFGCCPAGKIFSSQISADWHLLQNHQKSNRSLQGYPQRAHPRASLFRLRLCAVVDGSHCYLPSTSAWESLARVMQPSEFECTSACRRLVASCQL